MATEKYSKRAGIRLTEEEHRAFTGAAERRDMSLSRWLAMAGGLMSDQDIIEYQKAERDLEEEQAEQARRELDALEALHYQMKRVAGTLWSLLEAVRDTGIVHGDTMHRDGVPAETLPAETLEQAARKIEKAADAVLKQVARVASELEVRS